MPLFAVVLAADFGAIHYVAQSPWGEPIQFSEGVAHLAEHLLVSHHLKGAIETLHCEFLGRFNARVDRARSLFWVAGRARSSTEVLAAVKIILDVVLQEIDVTSLGALLSYCQREVKNEILYRTKPDFKLTESLWHGLFPDHPLGRSGIGTYDSIDSIDLTQLQAAVGSLQSRLSSIILLAHGTRLRDLSSVCEQVIPPGDQRKTWNVTTEMTTPRAPLSRQYLEFPERAGRVATAYALPPLTTAYSTRESLRQMAFAAYLFREIWNQKIAYTSDSFTRVFMVHTGWIDPWLVNRDIRPFLLRGVREEIDRRARALTRQVEWVAAWLTEDRMAMLRLCQVGLAHDIPPEEMLAALDEISSETLLQLNNELQAPFRSAQSYLGPRLLSAERE